MKAILRRAVEVDATVARYGSEFAVQTRRVAVGGQRLTIQGLGGVYDDIFLPLHGPHQAENAAVALAAVEAFFGAGTDKQLDITAVQDAFAAVASPGRLERIGTAPTILVDAAHNPHGAAALAAAIADEFAFSCLVGVLAVMADKDVAASSRRWRIPSTRWWSPAIPRPGPCRWPNWPRLAVAVFGEERVHTAPATAGGAEPGPGAGLGPVRCRRPTSVGPGAGIVVTGSVVTAGDARELAGRAPQ